MVNRRKIKLIFFLGFSFLFHSLHSNDLGVQGTVYSIEEEDFLEYIIKKQSDSEGYNLFQKDEKRAAFNESCKTPKSLNLPMAKNYRSFFFDPTVKIQEDIKNAQNEVIIKKGTLFNPLKQTSLYQDLIFFDPMVEEQLNWAKDKQNSNAKWVLVNGIPISLEERENRPVYFDQFGVLTRKLNIQCIPAKVTQEGNRLKVEEIFLRSENGF